jgi:hypothetical protein
LTAFGVPEMVVIVYPIPGLTRVTGDSAIIRHAVGTRVSDSGGYSSNAAEEIQLT